MLSAGASMTQFEVVLHYAYAAGASGFLAGRAIWSSAMELYPNMVAVEAALKDDAIPYMQKLSTMTDTDATPWFKHPHHAAAAESSLRPGAPLSADLLHGQDQDASRLDAGLDFRAKYGCP